MSRPHYTTEVVDPSTLSPAARAELTNALYASHRCVFDGVDRDAFAAYVVDSPAAETRIMVLRGEGGRVRGYAAMHLFWHSHMGRRVQIVRMEVAAEPAYRGINFAGPFIALSVLRLAVRFPGVPRYFFACFVHPSAYVSLCRHAPRVWPHPGVETPPHIEALMSGLERRFHLERVGEGTVKVGWIARGACASPRRLSPEARFYLEHNPGYVRGEGLMTVLDCGARAAVEGTVDFARHLIRRRVSALRASLPRRVPAT